MKQGEGERERKGAEEEKGGRRGVDVRGKERREKGEMRGEKLKPDEEMEEIREKEGWGWV